MLSVVIACYNAGDHLAAAVTSALEQEPAPAEVIVCDDGSTDRSSEVLRFFGDRVRMVRHAVNRGEAAAKNTAVRACTTSYAVFLDADDEFLPGRLAALQEAVARDPDVDLVTTDAYLVQDGHRLGRWYGRTNPLPGPEPRQAVLRYNPVFGHAAVRRSTFERLGGFDEAIRHATDWDLWIRMVLAGARLAVIPEPLALYRMHGSNASADRTAMLASALGFLVRIQRRDDLSPPEQEVLRTTIAGHQRVLARERLKAGLRSGEPTARRLVLALEVLLDARQPPRSLVLAAGVVVLPRTASSIWRRRTSGTWKGPGGRRFLASG